MNKRSVFSLLLICSLTACAKDTLYNENSFFDKAFLKEQLVADMPKPHGDVLLYKKAFGMTNPVSYIKVSESVSSNWAGLYANDVYLYLKNKNFKYLYSVSGTNEYNAPLVSLYAYTLKEANNLDDFYVSDFYSGQRVISGCWVFVYSNGDVSLNQDSKRYLSSPYCIVISNEGRYDFSYDDRTINYTYFVEFDVHSSFWF